MSTPVDTSPTADELFDAPDDAPPVAPWPVDEDQVDEGDERWGWRQVLLWTWPLPVALVALLVWLFWGWVLLGLGALALVVGALWLRRRARGGRSGSGRAGHSGPGRAQSRWASFNRARRAGPGRAGRSGRKTGPGRARSGRARGPRSWAGRARAAAGRARSAAGRAGKRARAAAGRAGARARQAAKRGPGRRTTAASTGQRSAARAAKRTARATRARAQSTRRAEKARTKATKAKAKATKAEAKAKKKTPEQGDDERQPRDWSPVWTWARRQRERVGNGWFAVATKVGDEVRSGRWPRAALEPIADLFPEDGSTSTTGGTVPTPRPPAPPRTTSTTGGTSVSSAAVASREAMTADEQTYRDLAQAHLAEAEKHEQWAEKDRAELRDLEEHQGTAFSNRQDDLVESIRLNVKAEQEFRGKADAALTMAERAAAGELPE